MFFAHDSTQHFYYYGEVEPYGRLYHDYLDSAPLIAFDVETISLKERIAIGIGVSPRPDMAFYFPLFPTESPVVPWHLLKDAVITKVAHNSIFDLACTREYEVDATNIMDTNVMSRLLCYRFNGLADLTFIHQLPVENAGEFMKGYGAKAMIDCPEEAVARKCMVDCMATLKLYHEFLPASDLDYLSIEMQTIPIMLDMADRGILLDQEERARIEVQLQAEVDSYLQICDGEGFNPGSVQQVSYMLAKRGAYNVFPKLPFTRNRYGRRSGNLSTGKEILERMEDPLARLILNYREKAYLLSHYIKPWDGAERAFTRFHLDAATGRPSSTDRNMQNIPGAKSLLGVNCRACLLPDSGIFTDMDLSQVELRILAHLSQDREMLHIYESEGDIHQTTADFLGITRSVSKNVNFAMIYGATPQTMADTAHIKSIERARQLREMWFQLFPQAGDWIQTVHQESLTTHRARTIFGRNIRLPDEDEESIDGIQRKAVNYPIQGSAAEILKRALIYCKDMPLSLQVHDELLVDSFIPADSFKPLENIAPFRTPVEVKYLRRWE